MSIQDAIDKARQEVHDDWVVKDQISNLDQRLSERVSDFQRLLDQGQELINSMRQARMQVPEVEEHAEEPEAHQEEIQEPEPAGEDGERLVSLDDLRKMSNAEYAKYRAELGPRRARSSARGIFG